MIEISGDYLEGGGAILRVATSLSAVTGKAVKVNNIRKGRSQPGLKTQHLESIKTLAKICNAQLKGDRLGSTEIEFTPGKIESKNIHAKIETAGSPGLLFQNIKIPASLGEKETRVNVKGGAICGLGAPPIPYMQNVTLPILEKFGYRASVKINKYGFFPKGGSDVEFVIDRWKDRKPLVLLEQGNVEEINGVSIASKHLESAKVADRQAQNIIEILQNNFSVKPKIEIEYVDAPNPGSVIVLWAKTSTGCVLGSSALGERNKSAEKVGQEAAGLLKKHLDSIATVDEWMSDQILPFLALVNNKSEFITSELTKHTETNMWVIKKFLDVDFKIDCLEKGVKISCSGVKN